MSFHVSGPFSTDDSSARWEYYSLQGAPSNVYDGHHDYTYSIEESAVNSSGTRLVHSLEMTLSKTVQGSVLSFEGNVRNLESHTFKGYVLVFITQNNLIDPSYPSTTWNSVFRGYGLNKTLSLADSSTDTFQGSWNIPYSVSADNIRVVAAVYDADEKNTLNGWPYAVQSVCDVCQVVIPEFPVTWIYLLLFLATATLVTSVTLGKRRSRERLFLCEH